MAGSATGVLAAPASAPSAEVAVAETLAPVLHGQATASGTGAESIHFSARTVGAASWDLLDDVAVAGRSGYQSLPAGVLSIGQAFEYQVAHCDDTGCTATGVLTGHVSPELAAGSRPGATRLPFTIGDKITAQVDVGTGNLFVSTTQLSLRRVAGALDLGLAYNSLTLAPGSDFEPSIAPGWRFSTGTDVQLDAVAGGQWVVLRGPNGLTGTFTRQAGFTTAYDSPATVKATLTAIAAPGSGWELAWHGSGDTMEFNDLGWLTALVDRSGNRTVFRHGSGGPLTEIVADLGPAGARTVTVDTADDPWGRIERIAQAPAGETAREASYVYDGDDRLVEIVDVLGRSTTFGYNGAGDLTSITAPGGAVTTVTYDAQRRVTSVTQPSDAAGDAVTRLVYSAGQTLVAGPNTDPAQPVGSVPHTSYQLTTDGMLLVASTTDPSGAQRSATYTPFFDVATATNSSGTTTFGYDPAVNGGESLTSITAATGVGSSYTYGLAAPEQYLPDTGTDAQGNEALFSYDGAGNALGTTDAAGASAEVARNGDGTVDTATAPNGAVTDYTNNGDHQLTGITPPANSTLGSRSYTYDGYGRIETYTSGRGITTTYTYDAADRVSEVDYSDSTPTVSYTYDSAGRLHTRTDASGVTTYGYDPLGRLASRVHTAGGGLLTYGYDLAGNLVAETDAWGTTSHGYDDRNLVESTTTPDGRVVRYAHDPDGRRTDTWFASNAAKTSWAAHTHSDHDASGRLTRVWTARASNDADRVSDLGYSYASPGASAACPTVVHAVGTDTGLRWSMTDHVAGTTTSFCYDAANRLTRATTGGGDDWQYAYDVNGNRTQTTKNGAVVDSQSVNDADQLDGAGYDHDASGNLTQSPGGITLSYNGSEQMTARGGWTTGSYTYAGTTQTELIAQTPPGGNTIAYTWGRTDQNDLPILESLTTANGTAHLTHDPTGSPLAMRSYTGTASYYALDGLGSPVALITAGGTVTATYAYDPWGQATIGNPTGGSAATLNPYRFAGGLHDRTTGFVKYGQRYYNPATGRFTQQDSLETLADPTRANRYQYTGSNPTNYIDPSGREFVGWDCTLAAIGVIGGAIALGLSLLSTPITNVYGLAAAGLSLALIGVSYASAVRSCP